MGGYSCIAIRGQRNHRYSITLRGHSEIWAPKKLITDIRSNLTSEVMQALAKLLEICHYTTSVEHLQSDGLIERLNRTIKTSFAAYVETDPTMWDEKLPFVSFVYNTAIQSTINKSPFDVLFCRKPIIPTTSPITWTPRTTNGKT